MTKGKILGDIHQIDKDVELCRTTNERISNQAAQLLIENQIPFTRGWIKVPFFPLPASGTPGIPAAPPPAVPHQIIFLP